jgi:hypothetical protein
VKITAHSATLSFDPSIPLEEQVDFVTALAETFARRGRDVSVSALQESWTITTTPKSKPRLSP